jgi:alcohol dehydrogenase
MSTDVTQQTITIGPFPPTTFAVGAASGLPAAVRAAANPVAGGSAKALVVTDRGLRGSAVIEHITAVLDDAGITAEIFADVHPNPTTDDLDAGGRAARALGAGTVVVPVGGGSALDAAKGIALSATNRVPGAELSWGAAGLNPALPIVAVPTTSGTGAEVNDFGVVTDPARHRKTYVGGPSCLAAAVLLDPQLTVSLPPGPTAASGIDCLTHAVESFTSVRANPWADGLDLQVVRLVQRNLRRAVADGDDLDARSQMLLAAHVAGQAMSTTGLGIVHGIGHPLGGRHDIPHGNALAVVLGESLRFNEPVRGERLARLAEPLGVESTNGSDDRNAGATIDAIEALVDDVRLTARLGDFGIRPMDLPAIVDDALADAVMVNTPRFPEPEQVRTILDAVL